jgi:hypothetical protein
MEVITSNREASLRLGMASLPIYKIICFMATWGKNFLGKKNPLRLLHFSF